MKRGGTARAGRAVKRGGLPSRPGSRRRAWKAVRRGRLALLAVGVVVVVGVLSWLLLFSSVLALRVVDVRGTAVLTPEQVLHQAEAPIGLPLARVSERAIGERVARLPAVDEVTVRRRPLDKLEILVTERVPVFGVGAGERVTLVDVEGAAFEGPRPDGLPMGEGPLGDPVLLAGASGVVTALPADLRPRVERVSFTSREAITVHLSDDVTVFFGSAEQAALKGDVALALIRGTGARHIDVSAPTRPSTR